MARGGDGEVSVTELAKMGKCETMALLDNKLGRAAPEAVAARAKEGVAAHAKYEMKNKGDSRCFIASWALGAEAEETYSLRRWRDDVLMKTGIGRALVRTYYLMSPACIAIMSKIPFAKRLNRAILTRVVRVIEKNRQQKNGGANA